MQAFEKLVRHARREPAPTPDVTATVHASLRAEQRARGGDPGLWFAIAGVACATVVGLFALPAWSAFSDPLTAAMLMMSGWWLI